MSARTTAEWLERMRDVNVLAVAAGLGRDVQAPRGASGGSIYGCPACNADRRHTQTSDKRGAVGIERSGHGWRCFQCDASGDALDFAAYALRTKRFGELGDAAKAEVREWCQRWLGLDSSSSTPHAKLITPPAARPEPEPTYPPADEVAALWGACVRVVDVPSVRTWLDSKRIDAITVADADLARALPDGVHLPAWAAVGSRSWLASGHRLIAPMVDARGVMRSVLARRVLDGDGPKSGAARGFQRVGLVLACGLARQVLVAGKVPEWWGKAELRIVVVEGEKKLLMRSTLFSDANEHAPAVIAVESGSWRPEHAARIPDGSAVFIATDPDEAGARYATTIVQSFASRIAAKAVRVELHPKLTLHVTDRRIEVKVRS